jgi:hypothetical protein
LVFWNGIEQTRRGKGWGITPLLILGFLIGKPQATLAFSSGFNLGVEGQVYRDPINPAFFPVVSAGLQFKSSLSADDLIASSTEYEGDLRFRISPAHPSAYAIGFPNLYWGMKEDGPGFPIRFAIGRKFMGWTKIDSLWSLGQIEPIDQWDRFRPFNQGLTGAFATVNTDHFTFHAFGSMVAIPENSPNVVIENQRFVAAHPQSVTTAPQTFNLLGQTSNLAYVLDIPPISTILFRPSLVASIETRKEFPFSAKFVYGYLPLNSFPIALQGYANLGSPGGEVQVTLSPRLVNHSVYNGEVAYRAGDRLRFGMAALIDQPYQDILPANVTYTPLTLSSTWSPWIEYRDPDFEVTLSQIWVNGGLDADQGNIKNDNGPSVFSSRMLYRNASLVSFKKKFLRGTPWEPSVNLKYIHEYSIQGDWIAGDVAFKLAPDLLVYAGGDLISSYLDVSPDRGAEFLADMRAMSRARIGVNYAF